MTFSWQNEDGEPIMDGAAYRLEQQLDMDAQADYMADHFYDDDGEVPDDCCEQGDWDGPGGVWSREGDFTPYPGATWTCAWCGDPVPGPDKE